MSLAAPARLSPALWIPVLWYLIESTQSVTRWMYVLGYNVQFGDAADGSPLDRNIFIVLFICALTVLARRNIDWGRVLRANRWLVALFGFMLLSVFWSDYPDITVKRWVRALVDVAMVLVVLTDELPLDAQGAVLRRALFINIPLSIILIKYFRTIGTDWDETGMEMWVGATPHKNVLGQVVMIGALYFVFELLRGTKGIRRIVYAGYLLMAFWILRGSPTSRSNTSVLGFAIGLLVLFGLVLLRRHAARIRWYVTTGAVIAALAFGGLKLLPDGGNGTLLDAGIEASGRDTTLTGRTELWDDLEAIAAERPVLGVGYGAFWVGNTHNLWEVHLWRPTQGHNGYLDVLLDIGVVGLLLMIGVILAAFGGALSLIARDFWQGTLHFVWLCVLVVHNFTESSYLRGGDRKSVV